MLTIIVKYNLIIQFKKIRFYTSIIVYAKYNLSTNSRFSYFYIFTHYIAYAFFLYLLIVEKINLICNPVLIDFQF